MSVKTAEKLRDKAYRDAYVVSHIRVGIPYQIRALREQEGRKWSQSELGRRMRKPPNVISRLEDPEYSRHTISTLLELASAFDVALLVKFVSYSRFLNEFSDVSPSALEADGFDDDVELIKLLAPAVTPSETIRKAGQNIQNEGLFVRGMTPVLPQSYLMPAGV
jgi:transcriptional regulator with XRE-family HTH domain